MLGHFLALKDLSFSPEGLCDFHILQRVRLENFPLFLKVLPYLLPWATLWPLSKKLCGDLIGYMVVPLRQVVQPSHCYSRGSGVTGGW